MKLIYFDCKGLAETSRLILKLVKQDYTDFRYPIEVVDADKHIYKRPEFEADRDAGLLNSSMGLLPALVLDDGSVIGQSKAIERHLAAKFDFFGTTLESRAKIDFICEYIRDLKDLYYKHKSNNELDTYFNEILPKKLQSLLKTLPNKGVDLRFCVGDKLSLADITIYSFFINFFSNDVETEIVKKIYTKSVRLTAIVQNIKDASS